MLTCNSCNAPVSEGDVFCPNCGNSLSNNSGTGLSGSDTLSHFIYELDEDRINQFSKTNSPIPYGCFAVFLNNGTLTDIKVSGKLADQNASGLSNFLNEVTKLAKSIFGLSHSSNKDGKQVYLIMDIKDLPIVKHDIPLKISGMPNAMLNFEFSIDNSIESKDSTGLFFQRFISDKKEITFKEFKNIAIANIPTLLEAYNPEDFLNEPARNKLSEQITKVSGISAKIVFKQGKNLVRRQIEVTKTSKPVACPSCSTNYSEPVKFCEECGADLSSLNFSEGVNYILSKDGEQMIYKITFMQDEIDNGLFSNADLNLNAFNIIQNISKEHNLDDLISSNIINSLNSKLNEELSKSLQGYISDIKIIDLRSAKEDWFFKTDALVNEELRNVEANKKLLAVEGAEIDLQEAAMTLALRRVLNEDDQELKLRRQAFSKRKETADIEVDEYALEADVKSKKRDIDKSGIAAQREDDISQLDHEKNLEKSTLLHDVELADITDEAKIRAKKREIDLENENKDKDQQRQIDKLKAMSEIEANMAKQDNEFEMQQTDKMKGLSPQEILALQASKLAKTAGKDGVADVVKSIADSQAAASGADIKDELYNKMLETQKDALNSAIEAQKAATDSANQSAEQFRKINEKSMETMSKVATAKANSKSEEKSIDNSIVCPNTECDAVFKGKAPKFCNKCGSSI